MTRSGAHAESVVKSGHCPLLGAHWSLLVSVQTATPPSVVVRVCSLLKNVSHYKAHSPLHADIHLDEMTLQLNAKYSISSVRAFSTFSRK
jgi:hypothetical protein